jgi:hypothetical protein
MLRPTVTRVQTLDDSRLYLEFDNGETRVFDVGPYIKGSWYGRLADAAYFARAAANGYSVEWPDGQDLCPDALYYDSVPVEQSALAP